MQRSAWEEIAALSPASICLKYRLFMGCCPDTLIKNMSERCIITVVGVNAGVGPLLSFSQAPVDCVTRVEDEPFEKNALGPPVAFSEGMRNVERAVGFGNRGNEYVTGIAFKPARLGNPCKLLPDLRLDELRVAEPRTAFADCHCPDLSSPSINFGKQGAMD